MTVTRDKRRVETAPDRLSGGTENEYLQRHGTGDAAAGGGPVPGSAACSGVWGHFTPAGVIDSPAAPSPPGATPWRREGTPGSRQQLATIEPILNSPLESLRDFPDRGKTPFAYHPPYGHRYPMGAIRAAGGRGTARVHLPGQGERAPGAGDHRRPFQLRRGGYPAPPG